MSASTHNVLVIRRRYLGDIVLLGPIFRNLRLHWPQARLTALVEPAYADVLALNPDVDAVVPLPRSGASPGFWWRTLRALRRGRFTHVFNLDNVPKTALLTRWTDAPFRAGLFYELPHRLTGLYTHRVIDPPAEHEQRSIAEYYLRVLAAAEVPVVSHEIRLIPREADLAFARELLGRLFRPVIPAPTRFLLVHPGSRSPFRLWPTERFGEVCRRVRAELNARVVLIAGPGEERMLQAILAHAGSDQLVIDRSLSVPQFAALATLADALLCHDSGPMHVATAVGTPVVALFGSQNVALWRPVGDRHVLLQAPTPCGDACVAPGQCVPSDSYRSYCVRRIPVDEVCAAVRTLFASLPARSL
ncbi:MAG TPA: glycosyltransferase family 9 protein [Opitutaceae bacterium]|nr:glycosyltransferase family 9 protein [Opitutaceae bacterium]